MAQTGRISGPLLQANLLRQGKDLSFADTNDSDTLLYLDVNNLRLGINRDSATQTIDIAGKGFTNNLLSTTSTLGNLEFRNNTIEAAVGEIFFNAASVISVPEIDNNTIRIDDNKIETTVSNADLDVQKGQGSVSISNNLDVYGDIFTPSNIVIDGSITFGDNQSEDTVQFNTEVNSDIIPDDSTPASLGSSSKQWKDLYTRLVNGKEVETGSVDARGVQYSLRQGNIFYVSTEGSDANTGDHTQDPYRTLKRALDAADGSDLQSVTIHVLAGTYEEEFPLTVPSYVSVIGSDVRNTIVKPAIGFTNADAFLLDGDCTIENITVKDFYYDDNVGYAFRFKQDAIIKERSPYIQNVTVITKGSTVSPQDPRGFAAGDAGGGAYVDGAVLDPASESASMLFSGCTFITPNADALVMTNGVRVEWLTCFTYFARRGIYAFNNSTGRVTETGLTKFGAEIRSIASANVYGTLGAVADGDDCLMYLINHNFAYIGVNERTDNDNTLAEESQEVTEENNGKIVFTSIDHTGKYKVGNDFFVDFDSGITSLDVSAITADAFTTIRLEDNGSQTIFDVNQLRTGNLVFKDNLLESLQGDIDINSAVDINFNSDVDIQKDLFIRDNFGFGGSINLLGDQPTDTVTFEVELSQDFLPDKDLVHSLGTAQKVWARIWLTQIHADSVDIQNNYITSNQSNSDLELKANGSGKIFIPESFTIKNNLAQTGSISVENLSVNSISLLQDFTAATDFDTTGSVSISQNLTALEDIKFKSIEIKENRITSIDSENSIVGNYFVPGYVVTGYASAGGIDLELRANQTGIIRMSTPEVMFKNNLEVGYLQAFSNVTLSGQVEFSRAQIADVFINDNVISTNAELENYFAPGYVSNGYAAGGLDLKLAADGLGDVILEDFKFENNRVKTVADSFVIRPNQDISINGTGSIQAPLGTHGYAGEQSQFRFNTEDSVFEGFTPTARMGFGGVYSDDRRTSVLADDQNQINFVTDTESVGQIRTDALEVFSINVDSINIDSNGIKISGLTPLSSENDQLIITEDNDNIISEGIAFGLEFQTNQSAGTVLYDTRIIDNRIQNQSTDDLTFSSTNLGYWKISSSNGVVVPFSTTEDRPATAQVGDTRWNTTTELLEVWNGNEYISAAGLEDTVTAAEFDDLITEYTLIFG